MKYLVFDDMSQVTETETMRLLSLVSQQRREQALRYQHVFGQFACLKSYVMLQSLFQSECLSGLLPLFTYNDYGKPRIEGYPDFSISHCKKAIVVAIDQRPIGVDVETVRRASDSLVHYTMNEAECNYIYGGPAVESVSGLDYPLPADVAFSVLWTQKEAVLKLRGTGIKSDLHTVLSDLSNIHLHTVLCIEKGYVYTIATRPN